MTGALSPELEQAIDDFRRESEAAADAYERGHGYKRASDTELVAAIRSALSGVRAATIEECATIADAWAEHYPTDLWPPLNEPPEPPSVDRYAAAAMRHASAQIAIDIRTAKPALGGSSGTTGTETR